MTNWKIAKVHPSFVTDDKNMLVAEFEKPEHAIECCVAVNSDDAKVRALEEIQRIAVLPGVDPKTLIVQIAQIAELAAAGLKAAGV